MSLAEATARPPPFHDELLLVIGRSLARDGQSATLARLLATCSGLYDMLLPVLYRTFFLTDRASIFIRDVIEEGHRRNPGLPLSIIERTVTQIPFGFDQNCLWSPYPPIFRTPALERAKLIHTLVIAQSGADASYRRCTVSWYVPPYISSPWPPFLASVERIVFPSHVIKSVAERYQGLPSLPDPNHMEPYNKWFEWSAAWKALCDGVRLLCPTSTSVCVHSSSPTDLTRSDDDGDRREIRSDGQIQEVMMVLDILRGLEGTRTVVYEAPELSNPLSQACTCARYDLLAVIKYAISTTSGPIKLVVVGTLPSTDDEPRDDPGEENKYDDVSIWETDTPPRLPNVEAECLWSLTRERSRAEVIGVPDGHRWPRDRINWKRVHEFLRRDLSFVDSQKLPRMETCSACESDW